LQLGECLRLAVFDGSQLAAVTDVETIIGFAHQALVRFDELGPHVPQLVDRQRQQLDI